MDDQLRCRCGSTRYLQFFAMLQEDSTTIILDDETVNHLPGHLGLGSGNSIDFAVCAMCGKMRGNWPLQQEALTRPEPMPARQSPRGVALRPVQRPDLQPRDNPEVTYRDMMPAPRTDGDDDGSDDEPDLGDTEAAPAWAMGGPTLTVQLTPTERRVSPPRVPVPLVVAGVAVPGLPQINPQERHSPRRVFLEEEDDEGSPRIRAITRVATATRRRVLRDVSDSDVDDEEKDEPTVPLKPLTGLPPPPKVVIPDLIMKQVPKHPVAPIPRANMAVEEKEEKPEETEVTKPLTGQVGIPGLVGTTGPVVLPTFKGIIPLEMTPEVEKAGMMKEYTRLPGPPRIPDHKLTTVEMMQQITGLPGPVGPSGIPKPITMQLKFTPTIPQIPTIGHIPPDPVPTIPQTVPNPTPQIPTIPAMPKPAMMFPPAKPIVPGIPPIPAAGLIGIPPLPHQILVRNTLPTLPAKVGSQ